MRLSILAGLALAAVLPGCASAPKFLATAVAVIEAKSGSKMTGRATFTRLEEDWVHLKIQVAGLAPGLHAVHIHEKGDCSAADGASAGGHWNPWKKKHGKWGQADGQYHLGDLGNIEVGVDGTGTFELTTIDFDMGCGCEKDVVGKSVVVHEKADDFKTDPTGNAGARVGCGPIRAAGR